MKNILYYILLAIWYFISLLPFRVLYFISDLLYYLVYYCIRYRRKVVRKNLLNSFPEKEFSEIIEIEKGFYSFFCDYVVETLKLFSITEKNMKRRMKFKGIDKVEEVMGEDRSCIVYLGHYCNWEWITSLPLHIDKRIHLGQIYHPLENKGIDDLFLRLRGRFNAESISMKNTLRRMVSLQQQKKQFMIGFISDQTPLWNSIHHWVEFLNQDTPVFTGTEKLAQRANAVVFYGEVRRVKRGYYECEFKPMSLNPKELPEYRLTDIYFEKLEAIIRREPSYWLWSHNRWKRQRK